MNITICKLCLNKSHVIKKKGEGAEKQKVPMGHLIYDVCIFILEGFSKKIVQVYCQRGKNYVHSLNHFADI